MKPTVVVVGPFGAGEGGVMTFQKNLMERSNLKERWNFVPFSTARPLKEGASDNYSYGALFNSGIKRVVQASAVTGWHLASFVPTLKRHNAAVIQVQSSDFYNFWEGMAYIAQAHAVGVPAIIRFGGDFRHFYTTSSPRQQRVIRRLLRWPEGIIVQSQGWKDYFSTLTDADRLHVVGNAVLPPPDPPDRSARATVTLLFICTADAKRKGVDAVLEMAPRLRGSPARLVFVAAVDEVKQRVRDLGLTDIIELHGFVERQEMLRLYAASDVMLLPSFAEGFPNSMLEAMAAGLPVIASPVGAVPEVLRPEVHGLHVPPGDAEALYQATWRLVQDGALRRRLGHAAWRLVAEEYALDAMFSRFDRVWQGAIEARRRR